jgi:hypothetical protein
MSFTISGLPIGLFRPLFGLSDAELAARGVLRERIDTPRATPCRITLEDAEPGETVLLLNHEHHAAPTPYRSRHAIYVREAADETRLSSDEMPGALAGRTLSVRAFDAAGMMVGGDLCEGGALEGLIGKMWADASVAYLHAHAARRGCYLARIDRA